MRNIIFLLLISGLVFICKPAHAGIPVPGDIVIAPLFADMQDWLPDFGEWYEKGMKSFVEPITDAVKGFINSIITTIKNTIEGLRSFFNAVWQSVGEFFETATNFFKDIWRWFLDTWEFWYNWIIGTVEKFYEWALKTIESFEDWVLEWSEYLLESIWEFGLGFFDWIVGVLLDMLEWCIDQLPEIKLPDGFEQGLSHAKTYGALIDKIFPVTEALAALALYITVYMALIVFSWVKSFIPFV